MHPVQSTSAVRVQCDRMGRSVPQPQLSHHHPSIGPLTSTNLANHPRYGTMAPLSPPDSSSSSSSIFVCVYACYFAFFFPPHLNLFRLNPLPVLSITFVSQTDVCIVIHVSTDAGVRSTKFLHAQLPGFGASSNQQQPTAMNSSTTYGYLVHRTYLVATASTPLQPRPVACYL